MKALVVFGTRPEAIKLAPVIMELRRRSHVRVTVVTTAQHRQLLDQVLNVFPIVPDVDLDLMQPEQTLAELSGRVLVSFDRLLGAESRDRAAPRDGVPDCGGVPDYVIVQGDTTSAFVCGLAAFYRGIPVAHVEAGLRTGSPASPFPEEMNRRLISALASLHFAPTARARTSLLEEGVPENRVFVTGNTIVDALQRIRQSDAYRATRSPLLTADGERLLLVTLHRRESWGTPLIGMCQALRTIAEQRPEVRIVVTVHPNPVVRQTVHEWLGGLPTVSLVEPLDYLQFVAALEASWLVLTDSGGVQEEAPVVGKPVLVLRETTERPEAVECGVAKLVGTAPEAIVAATTKLLDDQSEYARMARRVSPFGDGRAAERIVDVLDGHR